MHSHARGQARAHRREVRRHSGDNGLCFSVASRVRKRVPAILGCALPLQLKRDGDLTAHYFVRFEGNGSAAQDWFPEDVIAPHGDESAAGRLGGRRKALPVHTFGCSGKEAPLSERCLSIDTTVG